MTELSINVSHQLGEKEALRRIQRLLGSLRDEYAGQISGLYEKWRGSICSFDFWIQGMSVSGTINVGVNQVELIGELPFAATRFSGRIEQIIRERVEELLA